MGVTNNNDVEKRLYDYFLLGNNCKNYVIDGVKEGGGKVPTFTPFPMLIFKKTVTTTFNPSYKK